jgi:hypothetical protein
MSYGRNRPADDITVAGNVTPQDLRALFPGEVVIFLIGRLFTVFGQQDLHRSLPERGPAAASGTARPIRR